ncbi:DKNYY domain-containing protein [Vogesella amnigena]|uniref:DKNYY domain-containing protein n=1 Tax=Vogesella amnigena TaxID=1507449 RepID=A0ABV7TX18_9NEIS
MNYRAVLSLIVCLTAYLAASDATAFEKRQCEEHWYKQSVALSNIDKDYRFVGTCRRLEGISHNVGDYYLILDGKVYWTSFQSERHSPCSGKGVGAMGQMLDPVCYLPSSLQIHTTYETRNFWLVSNDAANFRLANTSKKTLQSWQRERLMRYAMDSQSVYLNSDKIDGADPATFEVLFPGEEDRWSSYSFARDSRHLYIESWSFPLMVLSDIVWLDIPCVKGTFSCSVTSQQKVEIGRIGQDLLFMLYGSRPTLFKNFAQPDLKCEKKDFEFRCRSKGVTYRIRPDFDNEASLERLPGDPQNNP